MKTPSIMRGDSESIPLISHIKHATQHLKLHGPKTALVKCQIDRKSILLEKQCIKIRPKPICHGYWYSQLNLVYNLRILKGTNCIKHISSDTILVCWFFTIVVSMPLAYLVYCFPIRVIRHNVIRWMCKSRQFVRWNTMLAGELKWPQVSEIIL